MKQSYNYFSWFLIAIITHQVCTYKCVVSPVTHFTSQQTLNHQWDPMFTIYPMGPRLGVQILIPTLAATSHQLSLSVCDWVEKRDCESWHSQHTLASRPSYWPIFMFRCDLELLERPQAFFCLDVLESHMPYDTWVRNHALESRDAEEFDL